MNSLRTTSSTPQSKRASVFSSDGLSLTAITGACERSRIARGRFRVSCPADQEGFHRFDVGRRGRIHPLAEFLRVEAGGRNASRPNNDV